MLEAEYEAEEQTDAARLQASTACVNQPRSRAARPAHVPQEEPLVPSGEESDEYEARSDEDQEEEEVEDPGEDIHMDDVPEPKGKKAASASKKKVRVS